MKNVKQPDNTVKHVTNRQGVQFARLARKSGVPRENFTQFLQDTERSLKFLNELKNENIWFRKLEIEAQKIGARIVLVNELSVNYTKLHKEAVMLGGPQTDSDFRVLQIGYLYPFNSLKQGVINETIILLNWPNGSGNYKKAIEWGLSNGLKKTVPKVPFAIGEKYPRFNDKVKSSPMCVVETKGCLVFQKPNACCVDWDYEVRKSRVLPQDDFTDSNVWFAFSK